MGLSRGARNAEGRRVVKVGDSIWELQPRRSRTPWRDNWTKRAIVGETSRSWVVDGYFDPLKLPKAAFRDGKCMSGWALSEEQIDDLGWAFDHQWKISDAVRRVDHDTLRAVAQLIGYESQPLVANQRQPMSHVDVER